MKKSRKQRPPIFETPHIRELIHHNDTSIRLAAELVIKHYEGQDVDWLIWEGETWDKRFKKTKKME